MAYITAGRVRAGQRRSLWNLLLIPAYAVPWFLLVSGSLIVLGRVYARLHGFGDFRVLPDNLGGVFMGLGSLFAWMGPSMILANNLVSAVPAARSALDQEATTVAGTDRAPANRQLRRLTYVLTPARLVVPLVGLVMLPS